jgi:hypothetical protein
LLGVDTDVDTGVNAAGINNTGVNTAGVDCRYRGIYTNHFAEASGDRVNDGSEIIINFELFHSSQSKVMLSFACLGSNTLADLIDFLHPTFIIGASTQRAQARGMPFIF